MEFEFKTSIYVMPSDLDKLKKRKFRSREKFDEYFIGIMMEYDDADYYVANDEFYDKVWEWYKKNNNFVKT